MDPQSGTPEAGGKGECFSTVLAPLPVRSEKAQNQGHPLVIL